MKLRDYIGGAASELNRSFLRTSLTVLGIAIGIASMVCVVSLGESGQRRINSELASLGINRVWYFTEDLSSGRRMLAMSDAEAVKSAVGSYADVSPAVYTATYVYGGGRRAVAELAGVTAALPSVENLTLDQGRFITESDEAYSRRVIVLHNACAEALFGSAKDAVDKSVTVSGTSFCVVGVTGAGSGLADMLTPKCYIPLGVAQNTFHLTGLDEISVAAQDGDLFRATETVTGLLNAKYGEGNVKKVDLAASVAAANEILSTFKLIIAAVAAVALVVGGIGVMNIMLVTVRERYCEIGVKKACGARDGQIFGQFLAEALLISCWGGAFGLAASLLMSFTMQRMIGLDTLVSTPAVIVSALVSVAVGVAFGVLPAWRAAKSDPATALRRM